MYSTPESPQYSSVYVYFECLEPIASMVINPATDHHVPAKIEFKVPHNKGVGPVHQHAADTFASAHSCSSPRRVC